MFYSMVPILALVVLLITNFEILFNRRYPAINTKALVAYRFFCFQPSFSILLIFSGATYFYWKIKPQLQSTQIFISQRLQFSYLRGVTLLLTLFKDLNVLRYSSQSLDLCSFYLVLLQCSRTCLHLFYSPMMVGMLQKCGDTCTQVCKLLPLVY